MLVGADGEEIESLAFSTAPLEARARLTEWFGTQPVTTETEPTHYCAESGRPIVTDAWGDDFFIVHTGTLWAHYDVRFAAYVSGAAVGGLDMEAFDGSAVGDPPEALLAALPSRPGAFSEEEPGLKRIYFDVPNAYYSAYAYALKGGPINQIIAPYALEESC